MAARWEDLAVLERAVSRPAPSARTARGHSGASRNLDGVAELFRTAFDIGCDAAQGFLFARPSEDPLRAGIAHGKF